MIDDEMIDDEARLGFQDGMGWYDRQDEFAMCGASDEERARIDDAQLSYVDPDSEMPDPPDSAFGRAERFAFMVMGDEAVSRNDTWAFWQGLGHEVPPSDDYMRGFAAGVLEAKYPPTLGEDDPTDDA